MTTAFRALLILNGLLFVALLVYRPSGEDPAGEGMRLGLAVFYGVLLAIVAGLYQLARTRWFRIFMLILLALPLLSLGYGIVLSI